jgi:hypothetical protein
LGGVFEHKAYQAQFDAFVPGASTVFQNILPRGVAGVVSKLDTPGAGRIANTDSHFA